MAEKFVLNTEEFVVLKKLSSWIKGTMNNQNGTIHVTNQRIVFCARNRWKTLLGGALLDMIWRSKKIRFQVKISDIEKISTYKYMGVKTHFRITEKGEEAKNYRLVFNGNDEFTGWARSNGFTIEKEQK